MTETKTDHLTAIRLTNRQIAGLRLIAAHESKPVSAIIRRLLAAGIAAELTRCGLRLTGEDVGA